MLLESPPSLPPLLRSQIFMKRVRKALNRHDRADARRLYEQQKPVYTLDHVLKERYPRFEDALADLDDALSMLALFAALPAEGVVRPERTGAAARLMREWLYYVARSHSLVRAGTGRVAGRGEGALTAMLPPPRALLQRKVFFSVKGAYFQAEVRADALCIA